MKKRSALPWTVADMPPQKGKVALVTGATDGLGLATTRALARAGAEVILASRDPEKGRQVLQELRAELPVAALRFETLDLAVLESVEACAHRVSEHYGSLDILVNNGGIAGVGHRIVTPDGFEETIATNYFGHFALTGRLLPLLLRSPRARVVSLASMAHRNGRIDFDNLQGERKYRPSTAYSQSKLAMLMFALELQARMQAGGLSAMSVAVHPGGSNTHIFGSGMSLGGLPGPLDFLVALVVKAAGQPAEQGAIPTLFAATAASVRGGEYYGPDGFAEYRGAHPAPAAIGTRALDPEMRSRLWETSERLTGVTYALLNDASARRAFFRAVG